MASGYILMHCDQNGVIFHILYQKCSYLDVNFDILGINIKALKKCDWFHSMNIYKYLNIKCYIEATFTMDK